MKLQRKLETGQKAQNTMISEAIEQNPLKTCELLLKYKQFLEVKKILDRGLVTEADIKNNR